MRTVRVSFCALYKFDYTQQLSLEVKLPPSFLFLREILSIKREYASTQAGDSKDCQNYLEHVSVKLRRCAKVPFRGLIHMAMYST